MASATTEMPAFFVVVWIEDFRSAVSKTRQRQKTLRMEMTLISPLMNPHVIASTVGTL